MAERRKKGGVQRPKNSKPQTNAKVYALALNSYKPDVI